MIFNDVQPIRGLFGRYLGTKQGCEHSGVRIPASRHRFQVRKLFEKARNAIIQGVCGDLDLYAT